MRNLKDILKESILDDVEDTIQAGDKLMEEFENVKSTFCNPKNYIMDKNKMWGTATTYKCKDEYRCKCENLISVICPELTNCDKISVFIQKHLNSSLPTNVPVYSFCIEFRSKGRYEIEKTSKTVYIPVNMFKTFPAFINKYVSSIFKDISSLKEFINEH